ncbi:hypothetical protein JIG36_02380 [Actinoplanes sp. LDG1-06]|uniref:Uncharacterized protein n=1 Tax=Paractinoplanes ovalisporus TaxID=2810368 RepID=A0ABS2A531_9ACTN|nr:hypothetical protein [Actinoplanes ovalisporus]MBM2614404.1 hypothetical protein [Actinoplanes ovalisporus]
MRYVPRALFASAAAGALIVAGPTPSQAAATPNVDAGYGTTGITTVAGEPDDTAVDSSGRALLLTTDGSGATRLTRLSVNGAKDGSFGTGGTVSLPYGGRLNPNADGSITVVGATAAQKGIRVHRLGSNGVTLADATVLADRTVELVWGVTGRSDGDVIVHGIDQSTDPATHVLAAVRPNATLDPAWGTNGVLTVPGDVRSIRATGNELLALTGTTVRRYTSTGGGPVEKALPAGLDPFSISVSGSAYFVNGRVANRMAAAKFAQSGVLETTFGTGGLATGATTHECTPTARQSTVTASGVYLIGHNMDCGASRVYVQKLSVAGKDTGELVVDQVGTQRSLGRSGGGAQPDGRIVVTFESANGTTSAVRLYPSVVVDPYVPVATARLLAPTQVGPQKQVTVSVTGTNVAAVALDVAVARGRASGGVLVYPTGGKVPAVSTHAHVAGQSVTQRVIVPIGAGGRITLRNASGGSAHLAANLVGWYRTGMYVPLTPVRALSARGLGARKTLTFALPGVPATARTVMVNVSVNGVTTAGSLKLYPAGAAAPTTVLATHAAKQPGNATARVTPGTGRRLTVLNNAPSSGNVTVDVVGYLKN